jgi:hypothetical protein
MGTVCRDYMDRMVTLSRRHLEATLRVYANHCNGNRAHRALGMEPRRLGRAFTRWAPVRVSRAPRPARRPHPRVRDRGMIEFSAPTGRRCRASAQYAYERVASVEGDPLAVLAQLKLGDLFASRGEDGWAEEAYRRVSESEDSTVYPTASLRLGEVLSGRSDVRDAEKGVCPGRRVRKCRGRSTSCPAAWRPACLSEQHHWRQGGLRNRCRRRR